MLVLNRKPGESIIINENIEVCILEASDGSVKLGISAPRTVKILRKEIFAEVSQENKAAAMDAGALLKIKKRGE
jgi:carbon storage regulator